MISEIISVPTIAAAQLRVTVESSSAMLATASSGHQVDEQRPPGEHQPSPRADAHPSRDRW